jgi:hypothetical protein
MIGKNKLFNEMMIMHFVLDQQAKFNIYSDSLFEQQSWVIRHLAPTRTHYSDSEPTSFCSLASNVEIGVRLNQRLKLIFDASLNLC